MLKVISLATVAKPKDLALKAGVAYTMLFMGGFTPASAEVSKKTQDRFTAVTGEKIQQVTVKETETGVSNLFMSLVGIVLSFAVLAGVWIIISSFMAMKKVKDSRSDKTMGQVMLSLAVGVALVIAGAVIAWLSGAGSALLDMATKGA